jgi:hypothetical protein
MVELALVPGLYRTGDIVADFRGDGTFEMTNEARGQSATGRYAVAEGILTLSEPEGDLRRGVDFPLDCALEPGETGFALSDAQGGTCGPLAGASFGPAE